MNALRIRQNSNTDDGNDTPLYEYWNLEYTSRLLRLLQVLKTGVSGILYAL
mgnify:CR=1 FL=1